LLRRDLEVLIGNTRKAFPAMYIGLVTHGAMLTVERGRRLWDCGLNQIAVSLDFLDDRHDAARGIPGLTQRILRTAPQLVASGVDLVIQAVIKADNIDCITDVVDWATRIGARVSLSSYTAAKNGNDAHNVEPLQQDNLRRLIDEVLRLKELGAPISSSSYYLERIPEFFEHGEIGGCPSGRKFVTVNPAGYVQRCSEITDGCHYTEWEPAHFGPTECGVCWVPCRGETQAPITFERIKQVAIQYTACFRKQPPAPVSEPEPTVLEPEPTGGT
jgi:MoaA/NifB/PqqE/SkfB family radical SAM enzyme